MPQRHCMGFMKFWHLSVLILEWRYRIIDHRAPLYAINKKGESTFGAFSGGGEGACLHCGTIYRLYFWRVFWGGGGRGGMC
jgi:hypothetical protein